MYALKVLLCERAQQVHCFAHTLNLAAKAILHQFEKAKGKKHRSGEDSQAFDFDDLPSLAPVDEDNDNGDNDELSDGDKTDLDDIEEMFDDESNENQDARNEEEIDNLFKAMSMAEQELWKEQVKPLRSALQKVVVDLFWPIFNWHVYNNRPVELRSKWSTLQLSSFHNGMLYLSVKLHLGFMGTPFPATYLPVGTRPTITWLHSSNSNRTLTSSQWTVNMVSRISNSQRQSGSV